MGVPGHRGDDGAGHAEGGQFLHRPERVVAQYPGVAGGELEKVGITPGVLGGTTGHSEQVGQLGGGALAGEEPVAEPTGPVNDPFTIDCPCAAVATASTPITAVVIRIMPVFPLYSVFSDRACDQRLRRNEAAPAMPSKANAPGVGSCDTVSISI